jgi:hypothetical protein
MMRIILAGLILCALASSAPAFDAPTGDEIEACTPDAMKLCWRQIWGAGAHARVYACLKDHRKDLSPQCDAVFRAHGK